jgi:hypothetical protein
MLLAEPPSLDEREITEKGSLKSTRRTDPSRCASRTIFSPQSSPLILPLTEK